VDAGEASARAGGPPRRLGPYLVEAELSRGGMGAVYRARHEATGAERALKTLLPAGLRLDPEEAVRFRREAEALARLDHPHLVRVHAADLDGPVPFLVQELLTGGSLAERLRTAGPLSPAEAARLVAALARAVDHAHAHGVLHRDLKPENVVFDERGEPRVVDFGVARRLGVRRLTQTGALVGTPAYMAPEQARGGKEDDVRTDVYGLGAVLYAALTGRPPVDAPGNVLAALERVLQADPTPPRRLRPEVPAALERVCLRALAKRPAARPPTAAALADALEAALGPASRRRRVAAGAAAVAALAAAALGVAVAWPDPERAAGGGAGVAEGAAADAGAPGSEATPSASPAGREGDAGGPRPAGATGDEGPDGLGLGPGPGGSGDVAGVRHHLAVDPYARGAARDLLTLALMGRDGLRPADARRELEAAADGGSVSADLLLGELLLLGVPAHEGVRAWVAAGRDLADLGLAPDPAAGRALLEEVAAAPDGASGGRRKVAGDACKALAEHGWFEGAPAEEVRRWFARGAEHGDRSCQAWAGALLRLGGEPGAAAVWLRAATDRGQHREAHPFAAALLAEEALVAGDPERADALLARTDGDEAFPAYLRARRAAVAGGRGLADARRALAALGEEARGGDDVANLVAAWLLWTGQGLHVEGGPSLVRDRALALEVLRGSRLGRATIDDGRIDWGLWFPGTARGAPPARVDAELPAGAEAHPAVAAALAHEEELGTLLERIVVDGKGPAGLGPEHLAALVRRAAAADNALGRVRWGARLATGRTTLARRDEDAGRVLTEEAARGAKTLRVRWQAHGALAAFYLGESTTDPASRARGAARHAVRAGVLLPEEGRVSPVDEILADAAEDELALALRVAELTRPGFSRYRRARRALAAGDVEAARDALGGGARLGDAFCLYAGERLDRRRVFRADAVEAGWAASEDPLRGVLVARLRWDRGEEAEAVGLLRLQALAGDAVSAAVLADDPARPAWGLLFD